MKKVPTSWILFFSTVGSQYFELEWLANVTLAILWMISFFAILLFFFSDGEEVRTRWKEERSSVYASRFFFGATVLAVFAAGWFVTGFVYFFSVMSYYLKVKAIEEQDKEVSA